MENTPLLEDLNGLRQDVEALKEEVLETKTYIVNSAVIEGEDKGEQLANITLAYRHLEDAKMRLGKVIQATQGKSVYDN